MGRLRETRRGRRHRRHQGVGGDVLQAPYSATLYLAGACEASREVVAFRLISAGFATPGQTVDDLLDSLALDMLLTFFWMSLRENRDDKGLAELDGILESLDAPVDARRQRAAANVAAMSRIGREGA